MNKIAVIDYGMGNLHSVLKALNHVAPRSRVILASSRDSIISADRIILPGQGAIGACMAKINALDLQQTLREMAANKPFLGICIGPQLLMQHSAENGGTVGLGLLTGEVVRFDSELIDCNQKIKIPHIGWNTIKQSAAHYLWHKIADNSYYYYVHSYHLQNCAHIIGYSDYGCTFPAAIAKDNIAGLQAHPEKSGVAGLQFLQNFANWQP